jgi:hypothetical protein
MMNAVFVMVMIQPVPIVPVYQMVIAGKVIVVV